MLKTQLRKTFAGCLAPPPPLPCEEAGTKARKKKKGRWHHPLFGGHEWGWWKCFFKQKKWMGRFDSRSEGFSEKESKLFMTHSSKNLLTHPIFLVWKIVSGSIWYYYIYPVMLGERLGSPGMMDFPTKWEVVQNPKILKITGWEVRSQMFFIK